MAIYIKNCSYAILEKMTYARIAYEEMKCRAGVNKVSWACWLGMASRAGYFFARHGQLHTVAIFNVLNFKRGEELETALLAIHILCSMKAWSNKFSFMLLQRKGFKKNSQKSRSHKFVMSFWLIISQNSIFDAIFIKISNKS